MEFQIEDNELIYYKNESGITEVTVPDGVTIIGNGAFGNCKWIKNIILPEGVTQINDCAFEYCTSLRSIKIPQSLTSIKFGAFLGCVSLTTITIPDNVTIIGSFAFSDCKSLTSLTIPASVEKIGTSAFWGCKSLTNLYVKPGNNTYISIDGVIYDKSCSFLVMCPNGKTSVNIPNSVTHIRFEAFFYCDSLTSVTISDSVKEIGACAFENCTALTNITIPKNVKKIGDNAFDNCTALTSVTILNSRAEIGKYALKNCGKLKELTISEYTLDTANWNWEKVFLSDVKDILNRKDYTIKMDSSAKYSISAQMFLKYSQPEAEAYIKKNTARIIKYFIEIDDCNTVQGLLDTGIFVTKRNINKLIDHAIEHTQNGGDMQIQILLTNYKYEKLGL